MLDEPAEWRAYLGRSFGQPGHFAYVAWFNYIRMAIDAGYYGVAMVNYAGTGEPETNHWLLICGARTEGAVHRGPITGEILTSCSVRGDKWYEAREFLKNMGGYDALLIRPKH